MPLLSFLTGGKKAQQKQQAAQKEGDQQQLPRLTTTASSDSTSHSSTSGDYVGVNKRVPAQANGGESNRLRLPLFRKHKSSSSATSDAGHSMASGRSAPPVLPAPARTSAFGNISVSTHSLPLLDAGSASVAQGDSPTGRPVSVPTQPQPQSERVVSGAAKKRSSLFMLGSSSRESSSLAVPTTTTAPASPSGNSDDSFNLRSFRHVNAIPGSRTASNTVDLTSSTTPSHSPRRPGENSNSDAGGMKVADFRARARRSSSSLPLNASPRGSVDLDAAVANAYLAQLHQQQQSQETARGRPPRPQFPDAPKAVTPVSTANPRAGDVSRFQVSSGETSTEDEEEDASDDSVPLGLSAARKAALARDATITKRAALSEIGHGAPPPRQPAAASTHPRRPSIPSSRSESGHSSTTKSSTPWRAEPQPLPSSSAFAAAENRSRPGPSVLANQASRASMAQSSAKKGRSADSDTSEDESDARRYDGSDSDEAPLGKLIPPKRPGSSHSMASVVSNGSSPARRPPSKPLVDINAPSTMNQPPPLPKNLRSYARAQTDPNSQVSLSIPPPLPSPQPTGSPKSATATLGERPPAPVRVATRETNSGFTVLSRPNRQSSALPSTPPVTPASAPKSSPSAPSASNPSPSASLPRPTSGILKAPSPHFKSSPNSRSSSPLRNESSYLSPAGGPPRPPFTRGQSPASSTASSSSRAQPGTPADTSDPGSARGNSASNSVVTDTSGDSLQKPKRLDAHGRRYSVSFEEPEKTTRGRSGSEAASTVAATKKGEVRRGVNSNEDEARKERRRSEAKAAIDLGNVIHGPAPVFDDDSAPGTPNQMAMPMNFNPTMFAPGAFGMPGQAGTFPGQPMFAGVPPMTPNFMMNPGAQQMDPSFMAAHQQAMLAAKQAYQIAVAQQAIAAAGDEWERSSNVSGWSTGMQSMPMMPTMNPAMGMGMGMQMQMQMPMQMPMMPMMYPGMMVPSAPTSMYGGAGSSVYGGSTTGRPGWSGSASVYGESFGPSFSQSQAQDRDRRRQSSMGALPFPGSNSSSQLDKLAPPQRPEQARQRARTGPSGHTPSPLVPPFAKPPATSRSGSPRRAAPQTPPSSFKNYS